MASYLLAAGKGKPKQIFLRRAYSTLYYAMFHALANCCSNMLIGTRGKASSKHAWLQVYRALDHGFAKSQCQIKAVIEKFPEGIQIFATTFVNMQLKRHQADYNPYEKFFKYEVEADYFEVVSAIAIFDTQPEKDRRAFASFVLLKNRAN